MELLRGLAPAEVAERVRSGRVNRVKPSVWREYGRIVARNLFTVFNALVVPAAIALFLLREYPGGIAVLGMVCINTIIALVQEIRAKRHLDQLTILAETRARVIRADGEQTIPASDVVVDDLVRVSSGEPIVADGPVLQANYLEVDEALLTGESDPVRKAPGDNLLSGSYCVAGDGVYRAARVGKFAFANDLAAQARAYRHHASPLQRDINKVVQILTYTAVALSASYVALYFLREGFDERTLVQMIAATITSMVPQGLVLMATLAFTLGAVRMTRQGALVQRLGAVESMAAVDMLCMDKTGTLTTNRLQLARVIPLNDSLSEAAIRKQLGSFAWATIDESNRSIQALRQALPQLPVQALDQLPFKSENRYSAVRVSTAGVERLFALGAAEALAPFLQDDAGDWHHRWRKEMQTGYRLLLFAESATLATLGRTLEGLRLRPLALVALSDELRPYAGSVLAAFAAQGVALKIISGDNPETVRATVAAFDLPLGREPVVSGDELAAAEDPQRLIAERSVFGRIAPVQKVWIVQELQRQRHHVAMIGDGVNDVLPIKQADLGIAMGAGSKAAKTVAAMVLQTNDFGVLPECLAEGRTILRNLARAGKLFLLKNVYTLILILVLVSGLQMPFPYLPQQVTLLNLITIGVPSLFMTLDGERATSARRKGYLREVGAFALTGGAIIAVAVIALQLTCVYGLGIDPRGLRTMGLAALVLMALASMLRVLRLGGDLPLPGDHKYYWLAGLGLAVFLSVMYAPPAAEFFQLTPLSLQQWLLAGSFAGVAVATMLGLDRFHGRSRMPAPVQLPTTGTDAVDGNTHPSPR